MRRAPWLCLLVAAACLDPTQATLELSTNAPCGGDGPEPGTLYESGVLAGSADRVKTGALNGTTTACGSDGTIGTIVLFPQDGAREASAVAVGALGSRTAEECLEVAQGRRDGPLTDCIIARRRVSFIDGKDLRLEILLDNACAGVVCPEDSTCQRATDAQGNVITECVSASVDCSADGTCEQPTSSATSTTGSGGADATTTSGQGGSGGSGGMGTTTTTTTAGTGGGNTVGVITATALPTSVNAIREVSGDNLGPLFAGSAAGVFRPAAMAPVLTYTQPMGVFPVELDGTSGLIRVVLSNGNAIVGGDSFVPTFPGDQIVDVAPLNQSTSLALVDAQQFPTLHKLTLDAGLGSLRLDLVATDNSATTGQVRSVYGDSSAFAVGTRACYWPGGASNALTCATPASTPLLDVWASGAIAFAASPNAVVQLTSALGQTVQPVPLDPSVGAVKLAAIWGSFSAQAIWAGGLAGPDSHAYLVRQSTSSTNWDEFTSPTLPAITDVFVASDSTVYFVAGGSLYQFVPPPAP